MATDVELVRVVARAPLRTARFDDLRGLGANVWRSLDRLVDAGALLRLTRGVYTAPPDGRDAREWRPSLEAAGLAVATARLGDRQAVLMGLGAARYWGVIPRALAVTTVAVPAAGRGPVQLDQEGRIVFVPREIDRLDAGLERTELGPALVTTPAQTLYDLVMRPRQGGLPDETRAAVQALAARVWPGDLHEIVDEFGRANGALRQMLADMDRDPLRDAGQ